MYYNSSRKGRNDRFGGKGEMRMDVVLYLHGKGGVAAEAARYRPLFPACDVVGFDYKAETPWEAAPELQAEIAALQKRYDGVYLIAQS